MADQLLPVEFNQDSQMPKYSAFGMQLARLEMLVNACLNSYGQLNSPQGREQFISSIEALYIALAPHLQQKDRLYLKTYIIKTRGLIDSVNQTNSLASTTGSVTILKKQAWALMEIMQLLKDKRGLGIPRNKKTEWEEEFAESLDLNPNTTKEVKKDVGTIPTGKQEGE